MLVSASCTALGQIAKVLPLPLPNESDEGLSKKKLMMNLFQVVNNPKLSAKVKEKGIRAVGLLCVGEKFPFMKELVEELLSTAKQVSISINLNFHDLIPRLNFLPSFLYSCLLLLLHLLPLLPRLYPML